MPPRSMINTVLFFCTFLFLALRLFLHEHHHDLIGPGDKAGHLVGSKGRVLDLRQVVELLADETGQLVLFVLHDVLDQRVLCVEDQGLSFLGELVQSRVFDTPNSGKALTALFF